MTKTILALTLGILTLTVSWSQINSGTITGLALDRTGAIIPGAAVSAVNEETQVAQKTATDRSGEYAVPYLAAGRYTVIVEKSGFSAFKQTGVMVGTGEQVRVDARLQVGSVGTVVEVKADA